MADGTAYTGFAAVRRPTDTVADREFVLFLISLYRDSPELWNTKSKEHMDNTKRSLVIKKIVNTLKMYRPNYTEDQLKRKINILRTNFNREYKKVEQSKRSGAASDIITPSLWYYNELLFLTDHVKIAPTENTEKNEITQLSETDSEPAPSKRARKKRQTASDLEKQLMTLATSYFQKPESEEDVIAKSWAFKLKKIALDQRKYAEKIINDVLFEGEMGTLSRNSVSFIPASASSNK